MIRSASWAPWLPSLFLLLGGILLLYQEFGARECRSPLRAWFNVGVYVAGALLIIALFWPEASPFGRGRAITPDGVASYAAEQDGAPIVTAQATGEAATTAAATHPGL